MSSDSDIDTEQEYSSDECDYSKNGDHLQNNVLKDRYLLLKKIGYGSFSSVWFVYDWVEENFYAIKIYNDEDYDEGIHEIKTLKLINNLKSIYIMRMRDYFIFDIKIGKKKYRHPCIILDLMACSLYELLKNKYNKEGMPISVIDKIYPQILESINEIHSLQIIHADIKPENILIKGYNYEIEQYINFIKNLEIKKILKPKVEVCVYVNNLLNKININNIDFINQKYIDNIEICLTDFGSIIHKKKFSNEEIQTRYYRSPEIILGLKHSYPCDIWAFGCLLFELITGKILFDPDKDNIRDRNYCHLFLISSYIGKIPKYMIDNSPYKRKYYNRYKFKYDNLLESDAFIDIELNKKVSDQIKLQLYKNLIKTMLSIDPSKRNQLSSISSTQ
jgi:serine/threonine-protein kinase SRPK3